MARYAIIILFLSSSTLSSPLTPKQYRSDYVYNEHSNAFYKLHTESRSIWAAKPKCDAEGAKLMVPKTQRDIQQLHAMFKKFPDLGQYVLVASDQQEHESAEEVPMVNLEPETVISSGCDVVTRSGDIETIPCWWAGPFMCKVDASDAPYDEQCGVFAKGYVSKIPTTGSCYKIPSLASTWNEAYAECLAEGAHLVVLNSKGEQEEIMKMIQASGPVTNARSIFFFFAGIRADRVKHGAPRVFRTVLNQTLEEAGYSEWSVGEPNNFMDSEYCGSLFRNDGKYNDLGCSYEYAFVCEKERKIVNK